jgi:uncharacterized protein
MNALIRFNNFWARRRLARMAPDRVLLLAPHCLQNEACECKVLVDADRCARCERCDLAGLLRLCAAAGVSLKVVAGGRQAIAAVRNPAVGGVIAVACRKELAAGIWAAFPKPVWAILNQCPCGPCRSTRVNLDEVADALGHWTPRAEPSTGRNP